VTSDRLIINTINRVGKPVRLDESVRRQMATPPTVGGVAVM